MADKSKIKKVQTNKHLAREQREAKQTRVILVSTIIIGVIVLGLVGYGIIDQLIIRPKRPVAQVGETVITVRDYESYVQYTRTQMLNQVFQYYSLSQQFGEFGGSFLQPAQSIASQLAQPVELGRDVLDDMVNNIIIVEEAAKMGITASDDEIEALIQSAFGFYPDGTPTPTQTATIQPTPTFSETQLALVTLTSTPDDTEVEEGEIEFIPEPGDEPDELQEILDDLIIEDIEAPGLEDDPPFDPLTPQPSPTLEMTPTPYTTQVFGENIKEFNKLYSPYNFDIDDLREIFKVQVLIDKIIEEITGDLDVEREEVWARHILVPTEDEALLILSSLAEDGAFHELAAAYSLDESNAESGGDLGWFSEGVMVPEFSDAAFSLEIGEISDPVITDFGVHIIQLLGRRVSAIPPQEINQQRQMAFNNWLNEKRNARNDIVIFEDWEKYVPNTPEIPQQLLFELFQQQQQDFSPPIIP